jgi:hypothetical protein
LHNKSKTELYPGHKLIGPTEEEEHNLMWLPSHKLVWTPWKLRQSQHKYCMKSMMFSTE